MDLFGFVSENARFVDDDVGERVNFFPRESGNFEANGDSGGESSSAGAGSVSSGLLAPGSSPARNPTTPAATPPFLLPSTFSFPLLSSSGNVSCSGVNIRVSLYPASRRRSSSRSYVLDVPRLCRGTCVGSMRLKLDGYLRIRCRGVDGGDEDCEPELSGESVSRRRGCEAKSQLHMNL